MAHDDDAVIAAGYKPQLQRSIGLFSSFAVSFSFISVLTGVFANYGFVLTKAGPFGIWSWWLVAIGHTIVACVFGEMAGRIPLTGSAYNWNNQLASPFVGWFTGWMTLFLYSVGVAAVVAAMMPALQSLFGIEFNANMQRVIGAGIILIMAAINIYGMRVAAHTNTYAVIAEIIALIGFGLILVAATIVKGHPNFELMTHVPATPKPYLPGFLMACLLGSWTLLCFEGAADVSEETVNAKHVAPRGIIFSMLVGSVLGFIFLSEITLAIPNVADVTAASDPLSFIMQHYLGDVMTKVFLIFVVIAMFACALINMTGAARVLFAISRDRRFIASQLFKKISSHRVPGRAIWLVTIVSICFILMADTATALYGAGAVLGAIVYLTTVLSFAFGVKKLPKTSSFSLGMLHWPAIIVASLWLVIEIGILTIPDEFHPVARATGGILVAGFLLYFIVGRKRRKT